MAPCIRIELEEFDVSVGRPRPRPHSMLVSFLDPWPEHKPLRHLKYLKAALVLTQQAKKLVTLGGDAIGTRNDLDLTATSTMWSRRVSGQRVENCALQVRKKTQQFSHI